MRRMRNNRRVVLASGAALVLVTGTAVGAAGTGGSADADDLTLEAMAARLAELERQNDTLQGRVRELESADGELWLTEQRAGEIRGIVQDVLADADSRASLQDSGITAGWNDGFFLQSPDGRFRLNVGGMVQTRYLYSHIRSNFESEGSGFATQDQSPRRFGWDIPHARLDLSGHVFGSGTRYRLMGQYANQNGAYFTHNTTPIQMTVPDYGSRNGFLQLLDAWIAQDLGNGFSVRVGQFKLPFDLGWEVGIANQLTGDRTMTPLHLGLGRSQGIELGFRGDNLRARVAISEGAEDRLFYAYKLATTNPMNSPYYDTQSDISVSARAELKLVGGWESFDRMTSPPGEETGVLLGVGFHWQKNRVYLNPTRINETEKLNEVNGFLFPGSANNYNDWLGFTADLTWNFGGAAITAAGYYHHVNAGASYLVGGFDLIAGNQTDPSQGVVRNPTFDVGTVDIWGASIYGSAYLTPEVECFVGIDWMNVEGGDFSALDAAVNASGSLVAYEAYQNPSSVLGITFGGTWYIDGEDLKFGANCTIFPSDVSPNWNTPDIGVRSSPSGDQYVLRAYFQLLF